MHAGQHLQPGGSRAGHGARDDHLGLRHRSCLHLEAGVVRSGRQDVQPCRPATRSFRSRRTTPSCMATSTSTSSSRPLPPLYLNCYLAQETCTGPNSGGYDVKEISAEVFLPLGQGRDGHAGVEPDASVRATPSTRLFDSTTNSTIKLEYRPIEDILLSGTFAEVFRAPTILDLYASPANNSSTFTDPCVGLTEARVAANPNLALACVGVPRDGSFAQPNGQVTGLLLANARSGSGDRRRHDVRHHLAAELPEQQLLDPCRLLELHDRRRDHAAGHELQHQPVRGHGRSGLLQTW